MSIWIIEPHDPLLFRDGRPFTASPGATARSLPFPFPSTIAGGVRSQAGLNEQGYFRFTSDEDLHHLKKVGIRGPILVQFAKRRQDKENWLVPAPCDALLYPAQENNPANEQTSAFTVHQLVPLTPLDQTHTDLEAKGSSNQTLWLVGLPKHQPEKPAANTPIYWYWEQFLAWLEKPDRAPWQSMSAETLGLKGPLSEERVHVAMNAQTRTGRDGFLFATASLEFTATHKTANQDQDHISASLTHTQQLGLAVLLDDKETLVPQTGPGCLGSERRIVNWTQSPEQEPSCPDTIKQSIVQHKACRLVLLTPAYFAQGHLPTWILTTNEAVTPQLKAIVNRRPQVVSGWDIANPKPKQSHRLAPAGTVLFLTLDGTEADIENWIELIWLHCISDDTTGSIPDQYRLDGFGLAALGTWTGETTPIQMDVE